MKAPGARRSGLPAQALAGLLAIPLCLTGGTASARATRPSAEPVRPPAAAFAHASTACDLPAPPAHAKTPLDGRPGLSATGRQDLGRRHSARAKHAGAPGPKAPCPAASSDYPAAHWIAAATGNHRVARRGSGTIDRIVIHVMQGSYTGTISWFRNPAAKVSAHYLVRSSDGDITQMVRDEDVAFHATIYNNRAIGIEHEGFVGDASWFTDAMYRSSAALTRLVAGKYGIPLDRAHIIGHVEVPGSDHTDPGPNWDWTEYMRLVTDGTGEAYAPEQVCGEGGFSRPACEEVRRVWPPATRRSPPAPPPWW